MKPTSRLQNHYRNNPLAYRLLGTLMLGALGLTVVFTAIDSGLQLQRESRAIERQLEEVDHSYADSLANSLWSFDREATRLQMQGILNLPAVHAVTITSTLGERYSEGKPPAGPLAITRTIALHKKDPVTGKESVLGTMEVQATREDVYREVLARSLRTLFMVALQFFLFAGLMLVCFERLVTRHLSAIASYVRTINLDTLDAPLALKRRQTPGRPPDELDQVTSAVNQMRLSLLASIDERRQAEDQRLQMLIREQAARADLQAAHDLDKSRTAFINAVTHDLRTPLTSIMGYAEFLDDGVGGELTASQQEFLDQIKKSTHRLAHMIDDLLDLARMEAGTFRLEPQEADFMDKLCETVDSLRPLIEHQRLEWCLEAPEGDLRIRMDAGRIGQVLSNLLTNAVKFSPTGGRLVARVTLDGARLRFELENQGAGIAPEDLPRLFQRFSQLPTGIAMGGTGLGLSISKAIVESHGGEIGVRSQVGRTTTFWFTLPA